MMGKIGKYFKIIIYIVSSFLVGWIVYIIYKLFKEKIFTPMIGGGGLNITQSNAIADQLQSDMDGIGTNEASILAILSALNEKNFKSVYNSFGLREYGFTGTAITIFGQKKNLIEWLKEELSDNGMQLLRLKFPNIL